MKCPHCKQTILSRFDEVVPTCIDCGVELANRKIERCDECRVKRRREQYRISSNKRYDNFRRTRNLQNEARIDTHN